MNPTKYIERNIILEQKIAVYEKFIKVLIPRIEKLNKHLEKLVKQSHSTSS